MAAALGAVAFMVIGGLSQTIIGRGAGSLEMRISRLERQVAPAVSYMAITARDSLRASRSVRHGVLWGSSTTSGVYVLNMSFGRGKRATWFAINPELYRLLTNNTFPSISVAGIATIDSNLFVTENATVGGTFGVTGQTTLSGYTIVDDDLYVTEGIDVVSDALLRTNVTIGDSLLVQDNATIMDTLTATTGVVTGTLGVGGTLTAASGVIAGTLDVGDNVTMDSLLTASDGVQTKYGVSSSDGTITQALLNETFGSNRPNGFTATFRQVFNDYNFLVWRSEGEWKYIAGVTP